MRTQAIYRVQRAVVAAAIVCGVFAMVPYGAQAQDKPAKPAAKLADGQTPQSIEAKIAGFRDKLQITGDQEAAWNNLAQVMRDNAAHMEARIGQWTKQAGKSTAVEKLRAHADMAAEYAQSFNKLIPAFEALYNQLSDDQKKAADAMFDIPQTRQGKKAKSQ
jgi:type III secretory pathway component EscR